TLSEAHLFGALVPIHSLGPALHSGGVNGVADCHCRVAGDYPLDGGAGMTRKNRFHRLVPPRRVLSTMILTGAVAVTVALGASVPRPAGAVTTGSVTSFGNLPAYGSPSGDQLNARLTGMASTP